MLNQAQLIGFTGADVEIRTAGDRKVAVLRACTSRYTMKGGERKDYATWHQVEIWNPGTVTWLTNKGLAKGTRIFVQGEIRNERFTDGQGQERFFSKVVVAGPGHELTALSARLIASLEMKAEVRGPPGFRAGLPAKRPNPPTLPNAPHKAGLDHIDMLGRRGF